MIACKRPIAVGSADPQCTTASGCATFCTLLPPRSLSPSCYPQSVTVSKSATLRQHHLAAPALLVQLLAHPCLWQLGRRLLCQSVQQPQPAHPLPDISDIPRHNADALQAVVCSELKTELISRPVHQTHMVIINATLHIYLLCKILKAYKVLMKALPRPPAACQTPCT